MVPMPMRTRTCTRELNVLITGFGPFLSIDTNPSWLAVKPLHNTQLDLDFTPSLSTSLSKPQQTTEKEKPKREQDGEGEGGRSRVRIQTVQVPVHYGTVLDLVPRIYGFKATSSAAKVWYDDGLDSRIGGVEGAHFAEGYGLELPEQQVGWEVVIHVGVGRAGSLRCETQAHKSGYLKRDANSSLAPLVTAGESMEPNHVDQDGCTRGFGKHDGYESFAKVERSRIDVGGLVEWLKEQGMGEDEVEQSFDPGRYLCDFIYYCSLCEAKRKGNGTLVIFIHVPPAGQKLEVERCTDAIRAIAWYLAKHKSMSTE